MKLKSRDTENQQENRLFFERLVKLINLQTG